MQAAATDRFLALPEWLANAAGRPAALRWHVLSCPDGVEAAWLQTPALAAVAARWPCCLAAGEGSPATGLPVCHPDEVAQRHDGAPDARGPRWTSGTWYLQPPARPNAAHAASRQRALRMLQLVHAEADLHDLEAAFREDATLAYQLLRLVNSAAFGARREITSYGQAILMMGRQPLKRWLNLLVFAARDDDARSAMLQADVALRARGMEALAQAAGLDRVGQDQAFIAGMLSRLDVLFGQPLPELLRPLAIGDDLRDALLAPDEAAHPVGALLQTWRALERRETAGVTRHWPAWGLDALAFQACVLTACGWTLDLIGTGAGCEQSAG